MRTNWGDLVEVSAIGVVRYTNFRCYIKNKINNKMNKNQLFVAFFLFATFVSKAQNVTATSGGQGSVGSMNVNYSIGEAFVTTYQNGNSILTQGFHQPYFTVTEVEENFPSGALTVFPNPTSSILQIQFEQVNLDNLVIYLSDITGKLIKISKVDAQVWTTDLTDLGSGYYLLTVTDEKKHKHNSFKIYKSN